MCSAKVVKLSFPTKRSACLLAFDTTNFLIRKWAMTQCQPEYPAICRMRGVRYAENGVDPSTLIMKGIY